MAAGVKKRARAPSVPVLAANCSRAEFVRAFRQSQCVVLRSAATTSAATTSSVLAALSAAHASDSKLLGATFTLENSGRDIGGGGPTDPSHVLSNALRASFGGRWYASFIFQKAPTEVAAQVAAALPYAVPRALASEPGAAAAGQATWFFIGANEGPEPLAGRPEHTDELSHDGTWHFQLSGSKMWTIRPTDELLAARKRGGAPALAQEVICYAGDVLAINTKLWWHSTQLPPVGGRTRARGAACSLSISYARDFVISGSEAARKQGATSAAGGIDAPSDDMTNVDGLFATRHIKKGTAILSAAQMPDCELPVSAEPNCEVCEDAQTGELVLIASRAIASGEFFTVPADSSDEEDSSGDGSDSESEETEQHCRPCRR